MHYIHGRQLRNRFPALFKQTVRVIPHCQIDIRVPRQVLRNLRMDAGRGKIRAERVPQGAKIDVPALRIRVADSRTRTPSEFERSPLEDLLDLCMVF
ncbi:MAG TPA: hypothetical protein VKX17_28115 [Planctomycetota bacterium]|nr:hypothetical protein [Planctomycetota bacterium]